MPQIQETTVDLLHKGLALHRTGALAEAAAVYRSVLAMEPSNADALHLLGLTLKSGGRMDEALHSIRAALTFRPDFADAHYNLGNTLAGMDRAEEAIASFRRALALDPKLVLASYNLGNTLRDLGDLEGAAAAFRAALVQKPDYVEARHNLANVLKGLNQPEAAIAEYRATLAQRPDLSEAHYNMALTLLLTGAMEEGLAEYEWRWAVDRFPSPRRNFRQPLWDGRAERDRVLLIHAEQAFGDTIQFCRYLPLIAGRAKRIILECRKPLVELLTSLAGVEQVIEAGTSLPAFDVHAPLLSLPHILATRIESIPANVPYLRADATKVAGWRRRRDERFTVGLIWSGNRKPDPGRTIGLAGMMPLIEVVGIRAVALQRELEPGDAEHIAALGGRLEHWGHEFADFSDTAAALEAVDLVVSIDTGPAHLSGALGRPSWVCLPFAPDWRWLMNRETSPWYPPMKLYRQERRGEWGPVIARIADDLRRQVTS
jgi:Tfp pilus assembly protein PilF